MVLLDSLVEQEALRRLPLSEHVRSLLPAVVEFPLGNAAGLTLVSGRDHSNVYPRLWELHGTGVGGCESPGTTRDRSTRWWGTQKGLDEIRLGGLAWQQPWALSQLLARLPPVEWFYQVAGSITSMGALQSFQWFSGRVVGAAVRYARGWVAFFWSVLLEWSLPGLLVFVVTDGGQRVLVFREARSLGIEPMVQVVQVWCVDYGSVHGACGGEQRPVDVPDPGCTGRCWGLVLGEPAGRFGVLCRYLGARVIAENLGVFGGVRGQGAGRGRGARREPCGGA